MSTTIVIPESVYIGYIIGSGGRTIRSIEKRTKTKIRWPYKSNPADRKFTIYGFGNHGAADINNAIDVILQLVNGRLAALELPILKKSQLILSVARDNASERQAAPVAQQQRYISDDDFVEILRWLRRFDLDSAQIASRKLRRLTQDNQMPRRHLIDVTFIGGLDGAAGYLSYAYIEKFYISCYSGGDPPILPRRELLKAPDQHIVKIHIAGTDVDFCQAGVLEEAICICRFEQFSVYSHDMPDWQISDDFLRRLGQVGCAKVDLSELMFVSPTNGNYVVTDDGILDYCFSSDLGDLASRERTLWINARVSIGPTFVKKCIEAHFESCVTANMELELHNADPAGYDASVFLEDLAEYAACRLNESETEIRYDIPGHADGMRLLIKIRVMHDPWGPRSALLVRRGPRNDEAFFHRGFAFRFI
ncbi:hypothetical protein AAVH_29997 [Aphelenchoides avenae]|nr:hypothetical protein AAVH_29997 [Aphelenchus avenae]